MTPRPNAARIGLFTLGGLALLVAAVVVVFGGRLFAATEQAVMHFKGSVYGLQVGSPVVFRGVRLGSVRSVGVVYAQGRFAVPVAVELDPALIRTLGAAAPGDVALSLTTLLQQGLTGQLATHSLLTGQLYIDLDLRPGHQPATPVPRDAQGRLEIPTTPTRFQSLTDQLDRVDLAKMTDDLTATLAAARKLVAGPEVQQTLAELAQAATSLKRLSATLDQRLPRLADAAQGTLAQASQASARLGSAADRFGGAADRVGSAAARAESLLAPDSRVLTSVQQAADELTRAAAALRNSASDESTTVQGVQRAMADLARAARAVRELADTLEQQPQSLIRGKAVP
jgi:paraquat-inducible protein B